MIRIYWRGSSPYGTEGTNRFRLSRKGGTERRKHDVKGRTFLRDPKERGEEMVRKNYVGKKTERKDDGLSVSTIWFPAPLAPTYRKNRRRSLVSQVS